MYDKNKSYKENLSEMIDAYRTLQEESEKVRNADRYMKIRDYRISVTQLNKFAESSANSDKGELFRQCVLNVNQMKLEIEHLLEVNRNLQGKCDYLQIEVEYNKPDKDLIDKLVSVNLELTKKLKKYEGS
jgi:hypothetical protein